MLDLIIYPAIILIGVLGRLNPTYIAIATFIPSFLTAKKRDTISTILGTKIVYAVIIAALAIAASFVFVADLPIEEALFGAGGYLAGKLLGIIKGLLLPWI